MKSLLIITRLPPTRMASREALDLALAAAAFGMPAGMLFIDDGVLQLLGNQDARLLQQKSLSANLQALPVFGVEEIMVCGRSLQERGMSLEQCQLPAQVVDAAGLREVIQRFDQVVSL